MTSLLVYTAFWQENTLFKAGYRESKHRRAVISRLDVRILSTEEGTFL